MKWNVRGFTAPMFSKLILGGALAGLLAHASALAAAPSASPSAASGAGALTSSPASDSNPSLVPLQLSPQRLQSIGVRTGEVERQNIDDRIATTGNVAVDEARVAYVQARFSGYIQRVYVDATYQRVRLGQPLFTIYSPELVATERELLVARENAQRLTRSSDPEVASDAASLVAAAAERLKQWNIPQREIERLESSGQVRQAVEIDSPASGYITEREALPNKYVQPETRLYTVTDLSRIWVFAQVYQNDLGRLKVGDLAELTVDTYPGRTFSGRVDFIYPQIDLATRTARVRLTFSNPDLKLIPGMYVNVALDVPMGEQIVIPAAGVLQTGTRQIVFVDRGGGNLEPREVQLGARIADQFVVLKGLSEGERIVTSANFLIDSESQLQAALGTFAPPPPGASAMVAVNVPQAKVELTTQPSPPRRGSNLVRVKLTSANGAPLSGAQVSVTFFMAAMPAMGMGAMRVAAMLTDRGNGIYEGSSQLQSGGQWQLTISATKNGQVVAHRQLSVMATGGM